MPCLGRKTLCLTYLLVCGRALENGQDRWGGIPTRKRPEYTPPPKFGEQLSSTTDKPVSISTQPSELPGLLFSSQAEPATETTPSPTEESSLFSDFDIEWGLFDEEEDDMPDKRPEEKTPPHTDWRYLMNRLVWPILMFLVFLVLCTCLVITCCRTRRQVFCCGLPLFDSTREAASNYDRASMRKENRRRHRKGLPDERLGLEDHELRRIATLIMVQRDQEYRNLSAKTTQHSPPGNASPYESIEAPVFASTPSRNEETVHHVLSRPASCTQEHALLSQGTVLANNDFE